MRSPTSALPLRTARPIRECIQVVLSLLNASSTAESRHNLAWFVPGRLLQRLESGILAKNIADCISEGGYLKEKTLGESSFAENFMEVCNLNFESGDFPESEGEYYLELNAYDFDTGSNAGFDVSKGNANLKSNCGLKGKTLPVCLNKSFYLIGKNQKSYRIDIISIINKADENV